MGTRLVDFSVVKQKIIKTDEILQMYVDNNNKLKKVTQSLKDINSKLERSQLENDRITFSFNSIKSKYDDLEIQHNDISQQKTSLEQKYNEHTISLQKSIKDLEHDLRMMKDLNKARVDLLPKANRNSAETKKIDDLEQKLQKYKELESQCKKENNKLHKENVALSKQISITKEESHRVVDGLQREKDELLQDLHQLQLEMTEKMKNHVKVRSEKDKEIHELKAAALATITLKNRLAHFERENKQLRLDILAKEKAHSVAIQTDGFPKPNIDASKTPVETKLDYTDPDETLQNIFNEMINFPNVLSPLRSDSPQLVNDVSSNEPFNVPDIVITPCTPLNEKVTDFTEVNMNNCLENEVIPEIKMNNPTKPNISVDGTSRIKNNIEIRKYRKLNYLKSHKLLKRQTLFKKKQQLLKRRGKLKGRDSVLRALQILKRSKINFTISNESALPVQWRDYNLLKDCCGVSSDMVSGPFQRSNIECLNCKSKICKNMFMMLNNSGESEKLLGFFNIKTEAISPAPSRMEFKNKTRPDSPLIWLKNRLHSEVTPDTVLDKLAELVSEKIQKNKQKLLLNSTTDSSEYQSETEAELQHLFESLNADVPSHDASKEGSDCSNINGFEDIGNKINVCPEVTLDIPSVNCPNVLFLAENDAHIKKCFNICEQANSPSVHLISSHIIPSSSTCDNAVNINYKHSQSTPVKRVNRHSDNFSLEIGTDNFKEIKSPDEPSLRKSIHIDENASDDIKEIEYENSILETNSEMKVAIIGSSFNNSLGDAVSPTSTATSCDNEELSDVVPENCKAFYSPENTTEDENVVNDCNNVGYDIFAVKKEVKLSTERLTPLGISPSCLTTYDIPIMNIVTESTKLETTNNGIIEQSIITSESQDNIEYKAGNTVNTSDAVDVLEKFVLPDYLSQHIKTDEEYFSNNYVKEPEASLVLVTNESNTPKQLEKVTSGTVEHLDVNILSNSDQLALMPHSVDTAVENQHLREHDYQTDNKEHISVSNNSCIAPSDTSLPVTFSTVEHENSANHICNENDKEINKNNTSFVSLEENKVSMSNIETAKIKKEPHLSSPSNIFNPLSGAMKPPPGCLSPLSSCSSTSEDVGCIKSNRKWPLRKYKRKQIPPNPNIKSPAEIKFIIKNKFQSLVTPKQAAPENLLEREECKPTCQSVQNDLLNEPTGQKAVLLISPTSNCINTLLKNEQVLTKELNSFITNFQSNKSFSELAKSPDASICKIAKSPDASICKTKGVRNLVNYFDSQPTDSSDSTNKITGTDLVNILTKMENVHEKNYKHMSRCSESEVFNCVSSPSAIGSASPSPSCPTSPVPNYISSSALNCPQSPEFLDRNPFENKNTVPKIIPLEKIEYASLAVPSSVPSCSASPVPHCISTPVSSCPKSPDFVSRYPLKNENTVPKIIPLEKVQDTSLIIASPVPSCQVSPMRDYISSPAPNYPKYPEFLNMYPVKNENTVSKSIPLEKVKDTSLVVASQVPNCPASPVPNCIYSPVPSDPKSPEFLNRYPLENKNVVPKIIPLEKMEDTSLVVASQVPNCPASPVRNCIYSPVPSDPKSPEFLNRYLLENENVVPKIIPLEKMEDTSLVVASQVPNCPDSPVPNCIYSPVPSDPKSPEFLNRYPLENENVVPKIIPLEKMEDTSLVVASQVPNCPALLLPNCIYSPVPSDPKSPEFLNRYPLENENVVPKIIPLEKVEDASLAVKLDNSKNVEKISSDRIITETSEPINRKRVRPKIECKTCRESEEVTPMNKITKRERIVTRGMSLKLSNSTNNSATEIKSGCGRSDRIRKESTTDTNSSDSDSPNYLIRRNRIVRLKKARKLSSSESDSSLIKECSKSINTEPVKRIRGRPRKVKDLPKDSDVTSKSPNPIALELSEPEVNACNIPVAVKKSVGRPRKYPMKKHRSETTNKSNDEKQRSAENVNKISSVSESLHENSALDYLFNKNKGDLSYEEANHVIDKKEQIIEKTEKNTSRDKTNENCNSDRLGDVCYNKISDANVKTSTGDTEGIGQAKMPICSTVNDSCAKNVKGTKTAENKISEEVIKRHRPLKRMTKLQSTVMRQMKEKQKMLQQQPLCYPPNSNNVNCDVRLKENVDEPIIDLNTSNTVSKQLPSNRLSNKINVVQNILIPPNSSNPIDLLKSSSHDSRTSSQVPSQSDPPRKKKKTPVAKHNDCDILSKIINEMDKVRPQEKVKTAVIKRDVPRGVAAEQWRKKILDIAEVVCNKDSDMKDIYASQPYKKKREGILRNGSNLSGKVNLLLTKLLKIPVEDEIPEDIMLEFKRLAMDNIIDITIYQVSKDVHDQPDNKYYPAPLMTRTQRIFLSLLVALEKDKMFEDIVDRFLFRTQQYIFRTGCSVRAAVPLTRLYLSLCRLYGNIARMRTFCCEAFFYAGDVAVPMLFTVVTSWIEVIPLEADVKNYPIAKLLVQLVHLKTCGKPGYNLHPLKCLLSQYHGYPKERVNCDTLFEEIFQNYLENPSTPTDYAIRLFCRNKDTTWVYKKLNEFFKPLIYKIPIENGNFKAYNIILMGKICRRFKPKNDHDSKCLTELKRWFEGLLEDNTAIVVKQSIEYTIEHLPMVGKKPGKYYEKPITNILKKSETTEL